MRSEIRVWPPRLQFHSLDDGHDPFTRLLVTNHERLTIANLQFYIGQLFYVESNANYLNVAVYENDKLQIKKIRLTIKQFEEATHDFPQLMRCHRAFVVNMDHVTYYQGSVGKGELHFDIITDAIPVSKTYARAISNSLCCV